VQYAAKLSKRRICDSPDALTAPKRDGVVVMSMVSPHGGVMSSNSGSDPARRPPFHPQTSSLCRTQPPQPAKHPRCALAKEPYTKNERPDIRAHCFQVQIRTSLWRLAAGHRRCVSAHLEAALQHAPQDRAVRKHFQRNIARRGSSRNWYDANAVDCAAFPDELKTTRKFCANIHALGCASRVASPSEEENSAAICAQLRSCKARAN
jgi:hypothetical protein